MKYCEQKIKESLLTQTLLCRIKFWKDM